MARVSILIPVYNAEMYIGEAINSILNQTYQDYEIIVVDDGSTDRSREIAEEFSKARVFSCTHKGISATRNYALSQAKGELIAFLDADDLWTKDKLERQVQYLDSHKECEIVFCRYHNFSTIPESQMTEKQKSLVETEIDHYLASACFRRSILEKIGEFSLTCAYGEDTDWTARMVMAGIDVSHCINRCLYLRRIHSDNITLHHNETDTQSFYVGLAQSIRERMAQKNKTK